MTNTLHPDLDHPAYHATVKLPKYNGSVTLFQATSTLDASRVLRRNNPAWTKEDHLRLAQAHANRSKLEHQLYSTLLDEAAQESFGRPFLATDYRISAIGCEEFSTPKKLALRKAAHAHTKHLLAARAHAKAANPHSQL